MTRAIVTVHLPTHRRHSLETYGEDARRVGEVYDENVGEYMRFLGRLARECGFDLRTDNKAVDPVFTIDERDHEAKKAAHRWLETVPDLWEWLSDASAAPRHRGARPDEFTALVREPR